MNNDLGRYRTVYERENNSVAVSKKANPEGGEGGKQREKYIWDWENYMHRERKKTQMYKICISL